MPRGRKDMPPGPGRPKGSKNKANLAGKEWAELLTEDEEHKKAFLQQWRTLRKLPPHMLVYVYQLAKGKPKDVVEHQGKIQVSDAAEHFTSRLSRLANKSGAGNGAGSTE